MSSSKTEDQKDEFMAKEKEKLSEESSSTPYATRGGFQKELERTMNKERDKKEGLETSSPSMSSSKTEDQKNESKDKGREKLSEESSSSSYATRGGFQKEHERTVNEEKDKYFQMSLQEKRKLYKCKNKFVTLDEIQTWPELFSDEIKGHKNTSRWWQLNKKNVKYEINEDLNAKISLFCGDITTLEIDAIANAANESLLGGGGVDGAIHAASGPSLRSECELLKGCEAGEAKITCGYKLPAKHVIHTVGPRGEHPALLEKCYKQTLDLLKSKHLKHVAFPCISTGIFGYPNLNAAVVALKTIREWLEEDEYSKNVDCIIFCLFLKRDIEIYREQCQLFFPLNRDVSNDED